MSEKTQDTNLVYAEAYKHCLEKLSEELSKQNIDVTPETISNIVGIAMEIVEASHLKGQDQKKLVNEIIRKIVTDAPISDEKEKLLLDMIDSGVVSHMIDLVVSATKGELNVNAAKKAASGCCWSVAKNVKNLSEEQ